MEGRKLMLLWLPLKAGTGCKPFDYVKDFNINEICDPLGHYRQNSSYI